MEKKKKIYFSMITFTILISIIGNVYAHQGRTDAYGGHRDNQNKSGLGSYHYHCGGHPAHLHTNGVCPYERPVDTPKTTRNYDNNIIEKRVENTEIVADSIKINENITEMKIGEERQLTAIITPSDVTDKAIKWETSNTLIASVDANGIVTANTAGSVRITASTENGKKDVLIIEIKEEEKQEEVNKIKNNVKENDEEDSGLIGTIGTVGAIGGISYLAYKKGKNSN